MANSSCSFFCLGLGIGAAVGLLLAPRSGQELRGELRSRADESSEYLRRRREELRHQAREVVDKGRGTVESRREQLAAALEAGREAYREAARSEVGSESSGGSS